MPTREWSLDSCLKNCKPKVANLKKSGPSLSRIRGSDITLESVLEAYQLIAKIIAHYGNDYLPIFERLHNEMQKYQAQHSLLNIAHHLGKENLSTENKKD